MHRSAASTEYLACERRDVFALLMAAAGMMGAYTFTLRGGVFCNAQTANIVMMAVAFGNRQLAEGLYFLIPISAYCFGAFISEFLPSPVRRLGFLRWDSYLIAFEMLVLFGIGFVPLSLPDQIVQVTINFITSMQYNTFRQAEGIPMATTFCTNHVRQVGIALAKHVRKHDRSADERAHVHLAMLACFFGGGAVQAFCCNLFAERAIWLAMLPLAVILCRLVHADLTTEHDMLGRKPHGH